MGDPRSDIYAVGALGYYLLAGQPVFEGATVSEVCRKHLTERPLPPGVRTGRPVCPQLESAILRCLEKDPAARPQSARELALLLAASPRAADWTPELRAAGWAEFRGTVPHDGARATPRRAVAAEATVKIELSERTP
jgi:serine/threonine protein kinase